jgi:hypothetical protein
MTNPARDALTRVVNRAIEQGAPVYRNRPALPADMFYVWDVDDIDSSFYSDEHDPPRPLFVCMLCQDTDGRADITRGYDPRDGIFERPGNVVESLGGIDLPDNQTERTNYKREIEGELMEEFDARREQCLKRGEN